VRKRLRTPENAERICELLAEGYTLRQVVREIGQGSGGAIHDWAREDAAGFGEQYARAMRTRWEVKAHELEELADADCFFEGKPDNALVQQARLRVDTRKWLLSKMLPKKYGDKVTLTGDPEAPLRTVSRIELVPVEPERTSFGSDVGRTDREPPNKDD
jgi:hypothetical protein